MTTAKHHDNFDARRAGVTPELLRDPDGQPPAPVPGGGERPAPRSTVRPERGSDRER